MDITLLVLAAGMGSRYGGLKQLDQLGPGGETLMDYSVFDAIRAGFTRVVFVIRRDFEDAFKEQIAAKYTGRIKIDYAFQDLDDLPDGFSRPADRVKPWGTGHAVLAARNLIREPFAMINADDFYGRRSYELLAGYLKDCRTDLLNGCLCAYPMCNTLSENGTVSRGICAADEAGNLVSVVEHTSLKPDGDGVVDENGDRFTGKEPVSMNCWGFSPALFPELERLFREFLAAHGNEIKSEFYIPFAVDQLIREGKAAFRMLVSDAQWFGVTYREDRPGVVGGLEKLTHDGEYPEGLYR
ncbi:MAG: NTP transferase domain-containing protein [Lentisphaeria bacterium]|nr:NTP transferase domain-containing protein [Lentisphaeria bacterium]